MKTKINANEPMHLIPVPAALMSHFLLAQEMRHKQAGIGDGGRSLKYYVLTYTH